MVSGCLLAEPEETAMDEYEYEAVPLEDWIGYFKDGFTSLTRLNVRNVVPNQMIDGTYKRIMYPVTDSLR